MSYPNMSYCMWQNTYQALKQVAADFEERLQASPNFPEEAPEPLSRDELQAMRSCFDTMRDLLEAAGVDDDCADPGQAAADAITIDQE